MKDDPTIDMTLAKAKKLRALSKKTMIKHIMTGTGRHFSKTCQVAPAICQKLSLVGMVGRQLSVYGQNFNLVSRAAS